MALNVRYNTVEFYTSTKHKVIKTYKYYLPEPQATLKFIQDGEEVAAYTFAEFRKKKYTTNYDFILYEIPIKPNDSHKYECDKYDKVVLRYQNAADVMYIEYNAYNGFELNVIQMTINDSPTVYSIDFGRSQYMMNGNVLFDRDFLKWYLNMQCGVVLENDDKYVITFIDHKMNYIILPEYCYLLIKKNGYDIINQIDI